MRNQWRIGVQLRNKLVATATTRMSGPQLFLGTHLLSSSSSSSSSSSGVFVASLSFNSPSTLFRRFYSSDFKSPETSLLIHIFSQSTSSPHDIKSALDSNNLLLTPDLLIQTLKHLSPHPTTAMALFDWVSKHHPSPLLLDSTSYNLMLGILGANGYASQFWDMLSVMKNKGFGVKRAAFDRVLSQFQNDGLHSHVDRLKCLFVKTTSVDSLSSRINKIVRRQPWDLTVDKDLNALVVTYSTELIQKVLEKLACQPIKALLFFRWVEENGWFKHDHSTYNTIAIVLGRQDCIDRFWNLAQDMRNAGYNMDNKTYVKVLGRFIDRNMMTDVVALYEFAMNGVNKPSRQDSTFLLRKLAVAKELDMDLFSRVVTAFTEKGFTLEDSMLDSVLKSLTSLGRMQDCKKVLDTMVEAGFVPSGTMQARVAYDLSSSKLKAEADEFMEYLEGRGFTSDYKTWTSLIEGHCVAGDFDKAKDCFEQMVAKEGIRCVGYALDMLVHAYCDKYRGAEACKILSDLVNSKTNVEPWHVTYKTLIKKLLGQKCFKDALPLLGLMKSHGFPPFVEPFVGYIATKGTADEAMQFFKALTTKKYPSTNIFIRVFEAYSKAGRRKEAQNLLAKCPQYIRNNADVLNAFCCMKSKKPAEKKLAPVAASVASILLV